MGKKNYPKLIRGHVYKLAHHNVLATYIGRKLSTRTMSDNTRYYRHHFEALFVPKEGYPTNFYLRYVTKDMVILDDTATALYGKSNENR